MATIVSSIGSGRDYGTIAAWIADHGGGAGGSGDDIIGELYNEVYDESFTINYALANSITLRAASGEAHDGQAGTGARIVTTGSGTDIIRLSVPVTLEGIEINANGNAWARFVNIDDSCIIRRCIFHNIEREGTVRSIDIGAPCTFINNIIYNVYVPDGAQAIGIFANNTDVIVSNNTVHDITNDDLFELGDIATGIHMTDDASNNFENNIVTQVDGGPGASLACYSISSPSSSTCSGNISSDATAPGSNNIRNVTATDQYQNITPGSEDLHIKEGADCVGNGTDLGTTDEINKDIDNQDRDGLTWDTGADQLISVSTRSTPIGARQIGWGDVNEGFFGN